MTLGSEPAGALPSLDTSRVPVHVGIIMDGNGRWAQARGMPRTSGHKAGTDNVRTVLEAAGDFGIKIVTLYAFSTENWSRPEAEVRAILMLAQSMIERQIDELDRRGARLVFLGRKAALGEVLSRSLVAAEERTRNNRNITVNIALNYGGRADIVDAVRRIVQGGAQPEAISEDMISAHLSTAGQPDPDLIIRTAGEMRLSNFLVWQAAYAEYYSTATLWPDFGRDELLRALIAFQARHRRFGTLTEAS
jgi:undecaprenyl diphosphate synthase